MEIYEIIRELREKQGMSQQTLAEQVGYRDRSSIAKIEAGKVDLSQSKIAAFAAALKVSPAKLLGIEDDMPGTSLSDDDFVAIEHVATVAAGYGALAKADVLELVQIPRFMLKGYPPSECKLLTVKGNSMYPRYLDGDRVVYHAQSSVDSGSIAVIQYASNEVTLKKVNYILGEDWLELIPLNPEYEVRRIEGVDLESCRVYGLVIYLMRDV